MIRCLLVVLAVLLGAAAPAWAQTTTFIADCSTNASVSGGGLTVTITANASNGCRANIAKYGGKWYFELTFSASTTTMSFGLANNGTSQPVPGGWALSGNIGNNQMAGGWLCSTAGNGRIWWLNTSAGAGAVCAAGKTAGVAIDLDAGPEQIWITPDVSSLLCDGAGNAGTTAPQWNGSCVNDPSIPGTGGPVISGTKGFWLAGYAFYPAIQSATAGNAATFNFGASAFAIASTPTGFSAWNTVGGGAPIPGPLNPQTLNIANAPGWQTNHAYSLGDRVVAGPGWAAGSPGSYTRGSDLFLWAVTVAGTSSVSGNGPQSCGTPSGYGQGLTGNIPVQWATATHATDGGVTWACLTKIDYVTLTGAFGDSAKNWTTGTTYQKGEYIISAGFTYKLENVPSGTNCTTGGSAPTGGTYGTGYSDGVCTWTNNGAVIYSSGANIIPHQNQNLQNVPEQQFIWNVFVNIWYGGQQRQVYQPGSNGESLPLMMKDHYDLSNGDSTPTCYKGRFNPPVTYNCNNKLPYWITMSPGPGDSFAENVNPLTQPLRVDQSKGVTFFSNAPKNNTNGIYLTVGESFGYSDNVVDVYRIQHQSTQGPCIAAHGNYGPGGQHTNVINLHNSILDCQGNSTAPASVLLDSGSYMDSSVFIWRSTLAGSAVMNFGYPGPIMNNTFVCNPSTTNSTAVQNPVQGAGAFAQGGALFPPPYKNNVMIGCKIGWSYVTPWSSTNGANNATDQASGASGTYNPPYGGTFTISDFPGVGSTCGVGNTGSCYNLVPSQIFVNPTIGASMDFRLLSTLSPIYGAGAFSSFSTNGAVWGNIGPSPLDVYNDARPTAGRYDLGGAQLASPPAVASGGRVAGRL